MSEAAYNPAHPDFQRFLKRVTERAYRDGQRDLAAKVEAVASRLSEQTASMSPEGYRIRQEHLPPAFREIDYKAAFMDLGKILNDAEADLRALLADALSQDAATNLADQERQNVADGWLDPVDPDRPGASVGRNGDSEPASVPLAAEDASGAAMDVPGAAGLSEAQGGEHYNAFAESHVGHETRDGGAGL